MKKPPDVIVIESSPNETPLYKWFILLGWALDNKDEYLVLRSREMILKLTKL